MLEDLRDYGLIWQKKVQPSILLCETASPNLRRRPSVLVLRVWPPR